MLSGRLGVRFRRRLPLAVYLVPVFLTCLWVLSLPVFPSQDGPLHLYYINIFRQLLAHQPGVYAESYKIRNFLPPYATYYYGLVALSHVVSLETADKVFACGCIVLFAIAGRILVRTVSPHSEWAPFLLLPVLLNWPLLMGFANFMLAASFACLALALWCKSANGIDLRHACAFLLLILAMAVTHPEPWLFTLGFVFLDLGVRFFRARREPTSALGLSPSLGPSLGIAALACLPIVYVERFHAKTQVVQVNAFNAETGLWASAHTPTFFERSHAQGAALIHTLGLQLFLGSGPSHLYRLSLRFTFWAMLLLGLRFGYRSLRARQWQGGESWILYGLTLIACMVFVPDDLGGGYFFVTRLQILLWLTLLMASAEALRQMPRLGPYVAAGSVFLSLFTLALSVRYITPVARTVASLRDLPAVRSDARPGLLLRPVAVAFPAHLNFDAYNWAPAVYFRRQNLMLFTTAWLGDPLIPVGLQQRSLPLLDATYFNQAPQFGTRLMPDNAAARQILDKVSFALIQREDVSKKQSPFAQKSGASYPGPFAYGWNCNYAQTGSWLLCQPQSNVAALQDAAVEESK